MKLATSISDSARDRLSMRARRRLAERRVRVRKVSGRLRVLPDFLILGAQRSGTSSLYRYLGAHPDLIPSVRKETGYFSTRLSEGENWYRAHFPLRTRVVAHAAIRGRRPLSFEATPDYLFHPSVPKRVVQVLHEPKFIVLLRDPVERAFSHYKHMRHLHLEDLTFEEALEREHERTSQSLAFPDADQSFRSALRYSYATRGRYADQLKRWFDVYPRRRFLIIDFADLFDKNGRSLQQIYEFLDIPQWMPDELRNYSRKPPAEYERIERSIFFPDYLKRRLHESFTDDNQRLVALTGREFSWI